MNAVSPSSNSLDMTKAEREQKQWNLAFWERKHLAKPTRRPKTYDWMHIASRIANWETKTKVGQDMGELA